MWGKRVGRTALKYLTNHDRQVDWNGGRGMHSRGCLRFAAVGLLVGGAERELVGVLFEPRLGRGKVARAKGNQGTPDPRLKPKPGALASLGSNYPMG